MFHDIRQNSDEWVAMRAGKITSSALPKIMANYGKAFGKPAKDYAIKLCIEQITGTPIESGYSNGHMERGHEQEPLARMEYESQLFCSVTNGGFFDLGHIGCSPDGLIGDDGVIEIKSVIPSVHYSNIKRQSVDPAYFWQLVGNLFFTERKWLDFISFCNDFPEGKKIYVYRMQRECYLQEFERMKFRISEFTDLMSKVESELTTSEYFLTNKEAA